MKWILPRTHIYLMKNENVSTKVFVFNLSLEFFPLPRLVLLREVLSWASLVRSGERIFCFQLRDVLEK